MPTDERDPPKTLFKYGIGICSQMCNNLRDVIVPEEELDPSLEEELELELELEIVKTKHGALLVYCSQRPVKAMPAFRMVW
jgi:hypothetical protein